MPAALLATLLVLQWSQVVGLAPDQRALLDLVVNQVEKGQTIVVMRGADIWISVGALEDAGVHRFGGDREIVDGIPWVRLGSLAPGIAFALDERDLVLSLTASPPFLNVTRVNLQTDRPAGLIYGRNPSAFLNYSLSWDRNAGYGAFADAGLSAGGALVATTLLRSANHTLVRGQTSVTVDERSRLRRWVFGDTFANTGVLGGAAFLGGASVSREYGLDPYFLRFPTLDMAGAVTSPSTLEVYVNDRLVRREEIAPGRFDLASLPATTGRGIARVVVRDAFGREQELVSSFYLTSGVIARGLQEYSYNAGYERTITSPSSWDYSTPAFLGRHRFGVTNRLTAGFRAELTGHMISAGPTMNVRLAFGEVELAGATSREGSRIGSAASVGYTYVGSPVTVGTSVRYLSPAYATVSERPGDLRTRLEANVYTAFPVGSRGSLNVRHTFADRSDETRTSVTSLLGSLRLGRRANMYVTAVNDWQVHRTGWQASSGIGLLLGNRTTADVARDSGNIANHTSMNVKRSLPVGTGFGYRVSGDVDGAHESSALQYQGRYGSYELWHDLVDAQQTTSLRAAGGLVAIGGGVYATRPVQDGFALLRVPDVAGVRAYSSNQEIGRTDRHGNLLVPGLLPYYGNRVSIADQDVPLDRTIGQIEQVIAPPFRGGALLTFPLRRIQGASGVVRLQRGDESIVPAYGQLTVYADGTSFESPIGVDGAFYLESAPPGRHPAEVLFQQQTCTFTIDIPASKARVVSVGAIACIESTGGDR